MKISVEISMYPLNEEYIKPILAFIEALKSESDILVEVGKMSTFIRGEHNKVMVLLTKEIVNVLEDQRAAFVLKVIKATD